MDQRRETYRVVKVNDSSNLYSPTDGYEDNYVYEPFDFEEYAREKARDDDENSPMRVIEFLFPSVIELEKSPSRGRTMLRSRSREKRPRRSRSRSRSRSKRSAKKPSSRKKKRKCKSPSVSTESDSDYKGKKSKSRKSTSPGKVAKISAVSRRVITGYEGKFPDCLKKDIIAMSEDEKHMLSHFVEINDTTGSAKFIWPSIAVKSNIVFMQEGKFKFTGDLKRHYNLINSFMTRVCKNWWPNDLAQLAESFRVVRDYHTNDIISGRYIVPRSLKSRKVLCVDTTAKDIPHTTMVSEKEDVTSNKDRSPSVEEINFSKASHDDKEERRRIKSGGKNDESKVDAMLKLIHSSLKDISAKQEGYDKALSEMKLQMGSENKTCNSFSYNPNIQSAMNNASIFGSQTQSSTEYIPQSFFTQFPVQQSMQFNNPLTPVQKSGQATLQSNHQMISPQMSAMMQQNLGMLGFNNTLDHDNRSQPRKKDQDRKKVNFIIFSNLCSSLLFIAEWAQNCSGENILGVVRSNIDIINNMMRLNSGKDVRHPMCKLIQWTASEGIWVDKAVQEILDMMNKSIYLSTIFLKKIFDKSTE